MVVNEGHPSGPYPPDASTTGLSYGLGQGYGQAPDDTSWSDDPLFGPLPGSPSAGYGTTDHPTSAGYGDYTGYQLPADPAEPFGTTDYPTGVFDTGSYPAPGFAAQSTSGYGTAHLGHSTPAYGTDPAFSGAADDPLFGAYGEYGAHSPWDSGTYPPVQTAQPEPGFEPQPDHGDTTTVQGTAAPSVEPDPSAAPDSPEEVPYTPPDGAEPKAAAEDGGEEAAATTRVPRPRRDGTAAPVRSRRRKPARRSALLTVAVPSVAVMGVAGVAAAAVVVPDTGGESSEAQSDETATPVASTKLDQQLETLTRGADDFATRASRVQERIDLKARLAAERKRKAMEAARREALRPKFALPVSAHGLSAVYGQAGVNWMSLHTGIDFPVSYGTPVMAATDGTVTTRWGGAYGNMVIVTAPDGTETWYCHLSSTKIRSGKVKAGQVIAYSGNSGNSTGPHLHFEVHPGGGAAVDPLQWLLSKGLDPR